MDDEDISYRCVLLKSLPFDADEDLVRECLRNAPGDYTFEDKVERIHPIEEDEETKRWIVLFKTSDTAMECREKTQWTLSLPNRVISVFPDYCSECIIPDEWTQATRGASGNEDDWVRLSTDPEDYKSISSSKSDDMQFYSLLPDSEPFRQYDNGSGQPEPVGKYDASRKFSATSDENISSMDMFGSGRCSSGGTPFSSIRSGDMFGSGIERKSPTSDTGATEDLEGCVDSSPAKGDADVEDVDNAFDDKRTEPPSSDEGKGIDIDDVKELVRNTDAAGDEKVDVDKSDEITGDRSEDSEKTVIKPELPERRIKVTAPVKTDVADSAKFPKTTESEHESQAPQPGPYGALGPYGAPLHPNMQYLYGYSGVAAGSGGGPDQTQQFPYGYPGIPAGSGGGLDQMQQQFPYGVPDRPVSYFIPAYPPGQMDPRAAGDGQQSFIPPPMMPYQPPMMPPGDQGPVYGWAMIPFGPDGKPMAPMPGQADFTYGQSGMGSMPPGNMYGTTTPSVQPHGSESHQQQTHGTDEWKPSPKPRKIHEQKTDDAGERKDGDGINIDEQLDKTYADMNAVHAYSGKKGLNAGKGRNTEIRVSHVDGRPPFDRSESTESMNRFGYSKPLKALEGDQSNDGKIQSSEGRRESNLQPLQEESIYDEIKAPGLASSASSAVPRPDIIVSRAAPGPGNGVSRAIPGPDNGVSRAIPGPDNGVSRAVQPKQLPPLSDPDMKTPPKLPPRESALPREPDVSRESALVKTSHTEQGAEPSVRNRPAKVYVKERKSFGEDSPATTSDGGSKKRAMIKVYHVTETMSKETLELFFESNKMSGGGPIKRSEMNAKKGEAIIEFERQADVQAVLDKQKKGSLVLDNRRISVVAYTPPAMDQYKVFMSGMSPKTTRESLELYIEACIRRTPTDIVYGDTAGTAMVTFAQPIDLPTMQSKCASRQLEGKTLELTPVEVTRSIKVKGYRPGSMPDALTIYFENARRSRGGPVESTDLKEDECAYILTFTNPEDAVNVCEQTRHVVDGYPLGVRLYYPCLDLDPDTILIIPDPIVLHNMDNYLTRYFGMNDLYKKSLSERLEECFGHLVLPTDKEGSIKIECTVEPTDEKGREKVRDWASKCKAAVELVCSILTVNDKLIVGIEVWDGVVERLSSMTISHPDYVTIFLNKEEHGVVVVGQTMMVEEIVKQIDGIVTSLEHAMEKEQQNITKSKMMRTFQMALLRASRFMDEAKKEGLDVTMDNEKREVIFKGTKKVVDNAMGKMRHTLQSFVKQSVPGFNKPAKDLLFEKETRDYIKGRINKSRIIGVWDVVKGEDLHMYGRNEKEVETAVKILQSCLKQKIIPLDWSMEKLIKSDAGQAHVLELELKNRGFMKIEVSYRQLLLVAVDYKFEEIENKIMEFFDMHAVVSEFMSVDQCKLRYIQSYQKDKLTDIEKQYSKLLQKIEMVETTDRTGYKIHGQKAGCKLAIDSIRKLVDSIVHREHTLSMPGIDKFLLSQGGQDEIQNIQLDNACVIKVDAATSKRRSAPTTLKEKAYYRADYVLSVMEGNYTSVAADAIVNPSYATMKHNTGIAAAIVDKGGYEIQKACSDHERKFGPLGEGDTFLSLGGSLPCQHIIHVVMPIWKGGVHNEQKQFKIAIQKTLGLAQAKHFRSIAFPVMGIDEFHFEMGVATKFMVEEIDYFFRANKSTGITKVIVCADVDGAGPLVKAMKDVYKKDEVIELRGQQSPMHSAGLEVLGQGAADGGTGARAGAVGKEIKVSLVVGELAEQQVDVIVNSTNHTLDMAIGNASRALLKAGGDSIKKECKDWYDRYPAGLQPGIVVATGAGSLPCKYLYHGVLQRWDGGQGHAEKVMTTFMERCLEKADEKNLSSIAFPALGTGNLGFPADKVALYIFECVESFQMNHPTTTISNVHVVLWKGDNATVKAFKAMEKEKKTAEYQTRKRLTSYKEDVLMSSARKGVMNLGEIEVEVVQGDLTQEKTGGIVNSVQENLVLSLGLVSNAILKAASQSIQTECDKPEQKRRIKEDGLVVTGPGKMFCKKIIHVRARNGLEGWRISINKCLEEAEFHGLNSLSFPALGTGGKSFSPDDVAKVMFTTIRQYAESKDYRRCLKRIRVVLFKAEMVGTFIIALRDSMSSNRTSIFPNFLRKTSSKKKSSVTVHIYKNTSVFTAITNQLDRMYLTDELRSPLIGKLKTEQEPKIHDIGTRAEVVVQISRSNSTIYLKGYRKAVSETKSNIDRYLKRMGDDLMRAVDGGQVSYPSTWTKMSAKDPPRPIMLLPGDVDYNPVVGRFIKEFGIDSTKIVMVQRIQNPGLFLKYTKRKSEIERTCYKQPVERSLWYGLDSSQVQNVIDNGFKCSAGARPKTFGVSGKSILPACHPDSPSRHKHVILASVVTGNLAFSIPGKLQKPSDMYNTTVDSIIAPTIFQIFDDLQAYPQYCITFL